MTRAEAIDILMSANVWNDKERTALATLIPELRESEDERIRKELIAAIDEGRVFDIDKEVADRWTAYLEKQKEQKPAEWSKNDTVFLNEITDFFENKTVRLQHDIDMYAHWLKSLPERFNLQPKEEWSEEDEQLLGFVYDLIADSLWNSKYAMSRDECLDRLTSLRQRLQPRPSWKPSEEQMYALGTVVKGAGDISVGSVGYNLKKLYEQLKKLK